MNEELIKKFDEIDPRIGQKLREVLRWTNKKEQAEAIEILTQDLPALLKSKRDWVKAAKFGLEIFKMVLPLLDKTLNQ